MNDKVVEMVKTIILPFAIMISTAGILYGRAMGGDQQKTECSVKCTLEIKKGFINKLVAAVTIENNSNKEVEIFKNHLGVDTWLDDVFIIERKGYGVVGYKWGTVSRKAPEGERYTKLKPGAVVSFKVNLMNDYNIQKAGTYDIQYHPYNIFNKCDLKSNVVTLKIRCTIFPWL
jgi:hypothetical protein